MSQDGAFLWNLLQTSIFGDCHFSWCIFWCIQVVIVNKPEKDVKLTSTPSALPLECNYGVETYYILHFTFRMWQYVSTKNALDRHLACIIYIYCTSTAITKNNHSRSIFWLDSLLNIRAIYINANKYTHTNPGLSW